MKMIGKWSRKKIEIANDINKAKHEEREEKKDDLNKNPKCWCIIIPKM